MGNPFSEFFYSISLLFGIVAVLYIFKGIMEELVHLLLALSNLISDKFAQRKKQNLNGNNKGNF